MWMPQEPPSMEIRSPTCWKTPYLTFRCLPPQELTSNPSKYDILYPQLVDKDCLQFSATSLQSAMDCWSLQVAQWPWHCLYALCMANHLTPALSVHLFCWPRLHYVTIHYWPLCYMQCPARHNWFIWFEWWTSQFTALLKAWAWTCGPSTG